MLSNRNYVFKYLNLISQITLLAISLVPKTNVVAQPPLQNLIDEVKKLTANETHKRNEACNETHSNNSFIYCYGKLLHAVNIHNLFTDPKTFVDMPMKANPEEVIDEFDKKFGKIDLKDINRGELLEFVESFFDKPGTEMTKCELTDWKEKPEKLMRIRDKKLRGWALELNAIWKKLCRKITKVDPIRNSIIDVPNEFIIPGSRYREFYYWDAYWIIKGLIVSGLLENAKKMIQNFAFCIDRFGFIPNGGRIYYLKRSQPPMFPWMVYDYYEATHDIAFLTQMLPKIEAELDFWQTNRMINFHLNGKTYDVYKYHVDTDVPRPESFLFDITQATFVEDKQKFYKDVASAAESGWDFSSRWFKDKTTMKTIQTTNVLPVDLNSLICGNLAIIQHLYSVLGKDEKAKQFAQQRISMTIMLERIFYNSSLNAWFDYHMDSSRMNTDFYAYLALPLFGKCFNQLSTHRVDLLIAHMKSQKAFNHIGGVPVSLNGKTGEKFDYPNGYSPLQHFMIEGMRKSISPIAQQYAFELAKKWVINNYKVYLKYGKMYDKYEVPSIVSRVGTGGEYSEEQQEGFGWTNGVALDLLSTYYSRLMIQEVELKEIVHRKVMEVPVGSGTLTKLNLLIIIIVANLNMNFQFVH